MGFCSNGSLERKSFVNHIVRSDQHVGSKINNLKNLTIPVAHYGCKNTICTLAIAPALFLGKGSDPFILFLSSFSFY